MIRVGPCTRCCTSGRRLTSSFRALSRSSTHGSGTPAPIRLAQTCASRILTWQGTAGSPDARREDGAHEPTCNSILACGDPCSSRKSCPGADAATPLAILADGRPTVPAAGYLVRLPPQAIQPAQLRLRDLGGAAAQSVSRSNRERSAL